MPETTVSLAGKDEIQRLVVMASKLGKADCYSAKRKTLRIKGTLWIDLSLDPSGEQSIVQIATENISEGGIAFCLKREMRLGQVLYVRDHTDEETHLWLKAVVNHCTRGLRGFLIGCAFRPSE
ncbi:MAG: PilZ domain-containing protein [Planctomycetes bacterium]|nr:PilZ domain-containing protein [Planctomycetota bacterium]